VSTFFCSNLSYGLL